MKKRQTKQDLIEILNRKKGTSKWLKFPNSFSKSTYYTNKFIDYEILAQSDFRDKYFVIELIRPEYRRKPEIRIGYYILGKKPSVAGKWVWGQFAPMVPQKDIPALFKKAQILMKRNNKSRH